ncbi:kelch repeat-containing protein [Stigmatella sp. ncwal1]|uniref:Kelch repeat-containing protein n=1 Tax=Stigmatella ashevillensis TaxID=2995309 RepID=A0ABT5DDS2_9BACT|nr:kelch repeat-containing protein [Stigmatella ashevillena]MDC0711290.1 kelch repeat-containing protein [Stigmatella ashevillena]
MASLRPFPLFPLLLAVLAGCGSTPPPVSATGSVQLAVSAHQTLSASGITRVTVTFSAADMPPLTTELAQTDGLWGGVLGDIPAGEQRSIQAKAWDSSGTLRYQGQAENVTITVGTVTFVTLTLQSTAASTPYTNEAPLMDAVVAAPTVVAPGARMTLTATAHDPNADDTLSFAWTASSGTFGAPGQANTDWTAPASPGRVMLTLKVSDSRGAASSVSLQVLVAVGTGGAAVDVRFNTAPTVAGFSSTVSYVPVDQPAVFAVSATDPDGDSLTYHWTATCAGTFEDASTAHARFTPSALPAGTCNNCQVDVTVSDGRGGTATGSLALCVARDTTQHLPPTLVRSYQSSLSAQPGQQLSFEVVASDPEDSALSFSWATPLGSLGSPVTGTHQSRLLWTAPACVKAGSEPRVTVTVTNAFNLTSVKSFQVSGLPTCEPVGWTAAAPMDSPRSCPMATVLPNGKVLVAGGNNAGTTLATAELYDPASNTWSNAGSMASPHECATTTLMPNGKVLVSAGFYADRAWLTSSAVEIYDPVSNSWSSTGRLARSRVAHTATLLPDGTVLVAGGAISTSGYVATAELYHPATGSWSSTGSMSVGRAAHTATLLPNGKVLVTGGLAPGGGSATAEVYNPASGTWSTTGSMAFGRADHTATLLPNGKVLVAGAIQQAELYDPASGTWSTTGSMASWRRNHTATLLLNDKVLVVGGDSQGVRIAAAEVYDPASGTWSSVPPLPSPRWLQAAAILSTGQVLIVGGFNSSSQVAEAALYTP